MKKILKKFRFWLIKKLGGEYLLPSARIPEIKMYWPGTIPLHAKVRIGDVYLRSATFNNYDIEQSIKKELAKQMVDTVLSDNSLYEISTSHDSEALCTTYRMAVLVAKVNPDE